MKLGVLAVLLGDKPFDYACKYISESGATAIEIGCGGFPGKAHCDPEVLLNDENKFNELFKDTYVYKHPTKEKNSYYILKFDFSGLTTTGGFEKIEKEFLKGRDDAGRNSLSKINSRYMFPEYILFSYSSS